MFFLDSLPTLRDSFSLPCFEFLSPTAIPKWSCMLRLSLKHYALVLNSSNLPVSTNYVSMCNFQILHPSSFFVSWIVVFNKFNQVFFHNLKLIFPCWVFLIHGFIMHFVLQSNLSYPSFSLSSSSNTWAYKSFEIPLTWYPANSNETQQCTRKVAQ